MVYGFRHIQPTICVPVPSVILIFVLKSLNMVHSMQLLGKPPICPEFCRITTAHKKRTKAGSGIRVRQNITSNLAEVLQFVVEL